jgi:dTDP-3-amino-2,3,6-trideoxy-4-keto-D-glucose/dTDP-3-amino-3,4,6-trideoxy-alpha-D-glucose/dTDP-2,6-dideoxy-D-kanosamine transaminase
MDILHVPLNDLRRSQEDVQRAVRSAVERVLDAGSYVLGNECARFEREFAQYCGVEYCLGVGNGTDALELSLRALGIGQGRRVATVANAGYYSATALAMVGAQPVYVDVDPDTQLADVDALSRLIGTGKVDAAIVTHLFGLMGDIQPIKSAAALARIPLIEDCAQAHGARRGEDRAGSVGDIAAFSFYPTKNLGAVGDGGAVVTNDPALAKRVASLRQYCWDEKYRVAATGGANSRLDEMQAAVLRAKLPHLDGWNARRREVAARYSREIRHPRVHCPPVRGSEYVAHLYVVACEERSALQEHLASARIGSAVHYPIPDHLQPVAIGSASASPLPITEQLAGRILTLPCFPELRDDEVERVIGSINDWSR